MRLTTCEYGDKFSRYQRCDGEGLHLLYRSEKEKGIIEYGGQSFTLKEPPFDAVPDENSEDWLRFARLLGLHPEQQDGRWVLKAHWFVGITRLPAREGEVVVQVRPKIEGLDSSAMLVEVLSHPVVSRHVEWGKMYEILTDEPPIEVEGVPEDYLLFLAIHYIKVLYGLTRRGLQKGHRRKEENLRGRVRGRILVGRTVRENWFRGRRYRVYSSFNEYSADTLENRILKAAFLKASSYLRRLSIGNGNLNSWIGWIGLDMEGVSTTRIYPTDFALTTVQRIRPDYKRALTLARHILKILGYDPTVEPRPEKTKVHPYWIDMNELFERYVEVKLRKGEIEKFKGWQVFPGYGRGEGIKVKDIEGELRPDFVLVGEDGTYAVGDAKYKQDYQSGWIKEDLQQLALYGRIKVGVIKEWIRGRGYAGSLKDGEPELYIFYPCTGQCSGNGESKYFRKIYKVGIRVPIKSG